MLVPSGDSDYPINFGLFGAISSLGYGEGEGDGDYDRAESYITEIYSAYSIIVETYKFVTCFLYFASISLATFISNSLLND